MYERLFEVARMIIPWLSRIVVSGAQAAVAAKLEELQEDGAPVATALFQWVGDHSNG